MADEKKDLGACDRAWESIKGLFIRCGKAIKIEWQRAKEFGLRSWLLFIVSSCSLSLLLAAYLGSLTNFLDELSENGPAWVQAVGSIGAILVVAIPWYLDKRMRRIEAVRESKKRKLYIDKFVVDLRIDTVSFFAEVYALYCRSSGYGSYPSCLAKIRMLSERSRLMRSFLNDESYSIYMRPHLDECVRLGLVVEVLDVLLEFFQVEDAGKIRYEVERAYKMHAEYLDSHDFKTYVISFTSKRFKKSL